MLRTLRRRSILSHTLPILVVIPLLGIALVYLLETQVLLPGLSNELEADAILIAEIMRDDAEIWRDTRAAEAVLARIDPSLKARVMLVDSSGRLLASSDPADAVRLGQLLEHSDLDQALASQTQVHTEYSQRLSTDIADVWAPVTGADGEVLGVVRLSYPFTSVYDQFLHLRYFIGGTLIFGLFLGTGVGLVLAFQLERPLRQVTRAVQQLASDEHLTHLPETGPEETRVLLHAVNSLAEDLHSLEQARLRLLANLVHELGRPLGALHSASEALLAGADEDAALRRELLVGMNGEIHHLQHLLDDLVGHYDQASGTLELKRRPIALNEWLPGIFGLWREAALTKGLHWQGMIPPGLPALQGDPDRLEQALGNLLNNAIKYTPSGGTVSVSVGVESDAVWVCVSDTGPGIALEEQERVFAPFYRSHSARRFPQGMGLGLSIARDVAVAHGGRLELESTPGKGSRFTLWLPLSE